MSFKKNKYCIVKNVISKDIANFVFNYFLIKRQVAETLFKSKYISPYSTEWGTWEDKQIPNTYSHYADIAMETLLVKVLPEMEKRTKLKLIPTYSYARIYKPGDVLERHKDRMSCEISTTINLGGDPWPIYLSPKENVGIPNGKNITWESKAKGIKVNLSPGDMLVYRGQELEHWREKFEGQECAQVFLHYNENTEKNQSNIFDQRPHIGLPFFYTGK
jgi:hypothetical protein